MIYAIIAANLVVYVVLGFLVAMVIDDNRDEHFSNLQATGVIILWPLFILKGVFLIVLYLYAAARAAFTELVRSNNV